MVKCGNCKRRHSNVAAVKDCYAGPDYNDGAAAAEQAYERHLEDRGYDEARFQDEMEARNGVISFSQAWDLADSSRVADRQDEEQAWLAKQRAEEAANSWS